MKTGKPIVILVCIWLITSMACRTINKVNSVKNTAEALATQAKSISDEIEKSGALKTAAAFTSKELPNLVKTAEAYVTQNPDLAQTASAYATAVVANPSENKPPTDIPILPQDEMEEYYGTREMVTYQTEITYDKVVQYYKSEMIKNGWESVQDGTIITEDVAVMNYQKDIRILQIIININPVDGKTVVLITIHQ